MEGEFGVVELLFGLEIPADCPEAAVSRARVSFDTKVFLCSTGRQILVWQAQVREHVPSVGLKWLRLFSR